ncbi:hypothetical protein CPB86DRAFT_307923 [Serendipita vermifera]|nr:hypothetical protein CPB86DRAFT_307923 [Serendipita vermifera]
MVIFTSQSVRSLNMAFQAILLNFSEEDRAVFNSILLQNYGLLICSLVFLLLNKLSPNDVDFAIAAVHSPVFHFLLFERVISWIGGSHLFPRKLAYSQLHQILLLGVIPLWIVLSGVTWANLSIFEHHASHTCAARLPLSWWLWRLAFDVVWVNGGLPMITVLYRLPEMAEEHLVFSILAIINGFWVGLVGLSFLLGYNIPRFIIYLSVLAVWGFTLGVYRLEADYDFQYGQLLSIIPCIIPLYSVGKLAWSRQNFGTIFTPVINSTHRVVNAPAILISSLSRTFSFSSLFRNPVVNVDIPLTRLGRTDREGRPPKAQVTL